MQRRFIITISAVLAACGDASVVISDDVSGLDDLGISEQSARVTPQQAQLAAQLVDSTRAYLPYAFTEDGCYARALYMSMELATRRVPSSAQYLTGTLYPSASVTWGWHVAPMVEIEGSTGRTVLDPALAPTGPITLAEWIRRSNPRGSYELFWTLGSTYYLTGFYTPNAQSEPVIQSFAELAPFQRSDVEHACGVMSEYLSYEGRPDQAQKRALLLGRTRSLANRLLGVGKLTGYQTQGALRCGPASVPLCKEAQERCTRNSDCCSTLCNATGLCQARPIDVAPTTPPSGVTDGGVRVDAGVPAPTPTPGPGAPDAGTPGGTGTPLSNGTPVSLSGASSSTKVYRFEVGASVTSLSFALRGTSGDADLYVRYGTPPTLTAYDARPYRSDSNETVNATPRAGTWYVMVHAYSAYSSATLTATAR
ncbi:MAG: pre-peptidase C-terminal domain-containing protein [Myxococcaceae bacterium]|nr:pre-peptidase C-terminal domain-containing protein [Myxococcaceae bacterium]